MKQTIIMNAALSIFGIGIIAMPVRGDGVGTDAAPATQPAGDVSALIGKLGDPDFHIRQDAVRQLKALGKSAIPALKEASKSENPEIHTRAEELLQDIDRPPAEPIPQPAVGGNTVSSSFRMSFINGAKSIDASEQGRTVHIEEGKDGIAMKVTGQIDGKVATREFKAKNADELKKDNPKAFALYQQYAGNGGIGQIRVGGGVILNGNAKVQIQGGIGAGGIVIQPGGVVIGPGANQPALIQPMPNPSGDNIAHLQDKIGQQMKDANLPQTQQDEVNGLLKQLRESVEQPNVAAGADARMREYDQKCDALRKKLADLKLPDPGDALPPPASQRLGITAGEERVAGDGLTVLHVLPGSRAEKLGLKEQDTIQKVDGKEVHSTQDLRKAVTANPKALVIEGERDGKTIKLEEKAE